MNDKGCILPQSQSVSGCHEAEVPGMKPLFTNRSFGGVVLGIERRRKRDISIWYWITWPPYIPISYEAVKNLLKVKRWQGERNYPPQVSCLDALKERFRSWYFWCYPLPVNDERFYDRRGNRIFEQVSISYPPRYATFPYPVKPSHNGDDKAP